VSGGPLPTVTLYGREGCHLCEEARLELLALQGGGARFLLREIDIETDERLHRKLLEKIPVVEVDGEQVCELLFEPDAVLARIDTVSA
jgi:glutathione S-transferase